MSGEVLDKLGWRIGFSLDHFQMVLFFLFQNRHLDESLILVDFTQNMKILVLSKRDLGTTDSDTG